MESRKYHVVTFLEEGLDGGECVEDLALAQKDSKIFYWGKNALKEFNLTYVIADLKLRSKQFYIDEINIRK